MSRLVKQGLSREHPHIYETDSVTLAPVPKTDSNTGLKAVLVDGAIGTEVGAGIGGLAEVVATVSLFDASPLLAPFVMLGWSASLGGLLGATAGTVTSPVPDAGSKENCLSALVRDAIASGQIVLVVDVQCAQEAAKAREVIEGSVGDYKDVRTV